MLGKKDVQAMPGTHAIVQAMPGTHAIVCINIAKYLK